jgi:hypothetical protein
MRFQVAVLGPDVELHTYPWNDAYLVLGYALIRFQLAVLGLDVKPV